MSAIALRIVRRRIRRAKAFDRTGWLMAVLTPTAMGGIPGLLAPWLFVGDWPGHEFPEIHRWHDAQWGAMMAILIAAPLIRLLLRPAERPLLLQFLLVATGALVLVNLPFNPLILLGLAFGVFGPVALLAYLHPRRSELLSGRSGLDTGVYWPLVTLSVLTGALLARPAWRWYDLPLLRAADEHSRFQHWTITAVLAVTIVAAGLLAATRRPGWRALGILAGLALIYLGVAAISVSDHAGSWGVDGGRLAILAGLAYIAATLEPWWSHDRDDRPERTRSV